MRFARIINYENSILCTALINVFVQVFWYNNREVVINFSDERYSIYASALSYMMLAMVILPFAIHGLLKNTPLRNQQVLRVHALSTVLVILVIACFCASIPPIAANWQQLVFPVPAYQQWKIINISLSLMLLLFVLIQFSFVLYTIIKLTTQRQKIVNKVS